MNFDGENNRPQVGENWYIKLPNMIDLKTCEIIRVGVEVITLLYYDGGTVTKTFMKSDITIVEKD